MRRFVLVAVALVASVAAQSSNSSLESTASRSEKLHSPVKDADEAIREVFRKISSGISDDRDDRELVQRVKEEIVKTAARVKTPAGSIESAAIRAQNLVGELTAAYTMAIYRSRTIEEAREVFGRFRDTVQRIVDFTKTGRFVT